MPRKKPRSAQPAEGPGEGTVEPLEPGRETGETREVGPRSSAARLPGRPPRVRVERRRTRGSSHNA